MHCPFCKAEDTKVVDSRLVAEGYKIRRRRECMSCDGRFTTFESAELQWPAVVKRNGQRHAFDEQKLRTSMQRALEKRPVEAEVFEEALAHILQSLRTHGDSEITSSLIGERVLSALLKLDRVAYVRFASVYLSFLDVNDFIKLIKRLEDDNKPKRLS